MSPRGGARPGSGRPTKTDEEKRVSISVKLHPRVIAYLDASPGKSRARKIETMVLLDLHELPKVWTDAVTKRTHPRAEVLELRGAHDLSRRAWVTDDVARDELHHAPELGTPLWALHDDGSGAQWKPVRERGGEHVETPDEIKASVFGGCE